MNDTWASAQQRTHNLATFTRMTTVWPKAKRQYRRFVFTDRQMEIAQAVIDKEQK